MRRFMLPEESLDSIGDLLPVRFECEVTRVEEMGFHSL